MNIEIDYLWSHKCPKKWDQYTLIALVITIIVLLILAGVTVATLTGENGLLGKAATARQRNKETEEDENNKLSSYEEAIDNYQTWERTGGNGNIVTISQDEYNMLKNASSYSADEKVIGTWIDNKPLYRKLINTTTKTTDISDLNIDAIHDMTGIIHDKDYDFHIGYSDHDGWRGSILYSTSNRKLIINTDQATFESADIVIVYTKKPNPNE